MRKCGFAKTHHHTMFGDALDFLINTVFSLFGIALIIRAWIYAIRLHPFNPYSQDGLRVTDCLIKPIRKIVPPGNRIDCYSLVSCWLTAPVILLLTWWVLTVQLPLLASLLPAFLSPVFTVLQ